MRQHAWSGAQALKEKGYTECAGLAFIQMILRWAGLVPENVAQSYVKDSACALAYLHELPIAHRDVKPQ
eukprot:3839603-Amphidinium_carterae.1